MNFDRLPLLPYFVAFGTGVALAQGLPWTNHVWMVSIFVLFLAWLCWLAKWRRLTVLSLACACFFLGIQRFHSATEFSAPPGEIWPTVPEGSQIYEGVVSSYPQQTEHGFSFRCDLVGWQEGSQWKALNASAQISLIGRKSPKRGDRIRFRASLHTPRNFGNHREFDFERYAKTRGIDLTGTIGEDLRWVRIQKAQGRLRRFLNGVREQAIERAEIYLSPQHFAIFKSLVLGERMNLDVPVVQAFRSAGIIHLLVVSGFHVSVLALVFAFLASFLFRRSAFLVARTSIWRVKAFAAALGALFFCLLTDLPIPTLRALLAIVLILFGVLLERPRDGLALWVAGAFGILLYQPLFLFDLSAQLSFLAVLGILLALEMFPIRGEKSRGLISKLRKWLKAALVVTCGATFATMPVLVFHFSRLTLWALPGNFLFAPTLGTLATPLGFTAAFLAGPFAGIGNFFFSCFDQLLAFLLPMVLWFRKFPASDLWIPRPSWLSIVAFVALAWTLYFWKTNDRVRGKSWSLLVSACFLGVGIPYGAAAFFQGEPASEIHILHVGEGDATLALSKGGKAVLIDAGPGGAHSFDAGERIVLPWLRVHGIDRLDVLAITHVDADHAGGARSLVGQVEVGEVWLPKDRNSFFVQEIRREAVSREIPWRYVDAASAPEHWEDMSVVVLHPPHWVSLSDWKSNDQSVVVRIEQGGFRTLVTGDIERYAEENLLERQVDLRADLLKVAHHGSKTSSSLPFLKAVQPQDAVITSGWKNHFGHPSPEVIARLIGQGIRIWRGDLCGEFVVQMTAREIRKGPVKKRYNGN